ncbi:hypothetical protein [Nocardioides sp. YR527]|nr:hypothetical protein [Nocardioides sp. YR527]
MTSLTRSPAKQRWRTARVAREVAEKTRWEEAMKDVEPEGVSNGAR